MMYTPDMYLWNLGSQCDRSLFVGCGNITSPACSAPGATTVTWAFADHCFPNHYFNDSILIAGQDLYNSYLQYKNYENHTVGLARIISCGGE